MNYYFHRKKPAYTPIECAAIAGNSRMLKFLLDSDLVEQEDKKYTRLLHLSAYNGHAKCVSLLIDHEDSDPKDLMEGTNWLESAIENNC